MRKAPFLAMAILSLPSLGLSNAAARAPGANPGCPSALPHSVSGDSKARAYRLDQLPPAAEIQTVLRTVDGCERPVIVRTGIGGNPGLGGQHPADVPTQDR